MSCASAGSVTPWQSHLGSEEYEPDARVIADNAVVMPTGQEWLEEDIARYIMQYLGHNDTLTNAEVAQVAQPYLYGYIWEVRSPCCSQKGEIRTHRLTISSKVIGSARGVPGLNSPPCLATTDPIQTLLLCVLLHQCVCVLNCQDQ